MSESIESPIRYEYLHIACGTKSTLRKATALLIHDNPSIYNCLRCRHCEDVFAIGPFGEFEWLEDGSKVGS